MCGKQSHIQEQKLLIKNFRNNRSFFLVLPICHYSQRNKNSWAKCATTSNNVSWFSAVFKCLRTDYNFSFETELHPLPFLFIQLPFVFTVSFVSLMVRSPTSTISILLIETALRETIICWQDLKHKLKFAIFLWE